MALENLKRCPAAVQGGDCNSPVFYDWGIELLDTKPITDFRGGDVERWKDWAGYNAVKICARCTTPYVLQAGELIDISEEFGAEDIKAVLARGQATLPHPKIKDP